MLRQFFGLFIFGSTLFSPVLSQFGVPNKRGGSFEERNEIAKDQMAGGSMADLANMDYDELMKMVQETMDDPATMEYLEGLSAGLGDAMEQLGKMSPEEIQTKMQENIQALASPDVLDSVLGQMDEVLESLSQQGLITEDQKQEYLDNPDKFKETMSEAFGEMTNLLSDPDAVSAVTNIMQGVTEIMKNPESALTQLAQDLASGLDDDEKIEEARLLLLEDPESAGNPLLA